MLLAAGDTFRAAAAEQLATWAERAGAELVRGNEGGDPSAVVFDAVERATSRGIDLVLADTAGRLHTKTNLMEELRKVRRVAEKGAGRVTEVLLVIDATTGQNGLAQAREFGDASQVTGVVLTKLDGSAKGGIVFAVETELGTPGQARRRRRDDRRPRPVRPRRVRRRPVRRQLTGVLTRRAGVRPACAEDVDQVVAEGHGPPMSPIPGDRPGPTGPQVDAGDPVMLDRRERRCRQV